MWGKVVKVKFVEHLMPEILYQIFLDRSTLTPVKPGPKKHRVWTHGSFPEHFCHLYLNNLSNFGVIRLENVWRCALSI